VYAAHTNPTREYGSSHFHIITTQMPEEKITTGWLFQHEGESEEREGERESAKAVWVKLGIVEYIACQTSKSDIVVMPTNLNSDLQK